MLQGLDVLGKKQPENSNILFHEETVGGDGARIRLELVAEFDEGRADALQLRFRAGDLALALLVFANETRGNRSRFRFGHRVATGGGSIALGKRRKSKFGGRGQSYQRGTEDTQGRREDGERDGECGGGPDGGIHLELGERARARVPVPRGRAFDSRTRSASRSWSDVENGYNGRVSNRAYLKVWCREVTLETLPQLLGGFLATVPFSRTRKGFTQLVLRAVETAEAPTLEQDLRAAPAMPMEIVESLGESLQMDSEVELEAWWDLWVFDPATGLWAEQPQRLEVFCHAPEFEDAMWRDAGHFSVDLGFEHLFTGHAGLLGNGRSSLGGAAGPVAPQHPAEKEFFRRMSEPEMLQEYALRTRENIRRLQGWVQRIAQALPLERFALSSEGEEDFEGRLDAIEAGD